MAGLKKTLAHLESLRRRFEKLTSTAQRLTHEPSGRGESRLKRIPKFGTNPGNLRMFAFVPASAPRMPALVVALHGCTQTADGYDHGTGWSVLADRHGFVVIYPEQQPANNPKNCFSWFLPGDTARERGEASSIRQMIEHAIVEFGIDRRRVFVTGLSAGGAMTSVMLATYPEVFAGGAIIAGLPYGCATSVQEAFEAMFTERSVSTRALGEQVRTASRHHGPWPKISVWHGSADPVVKPANAEDIVRQWTYVHALSNKPSHEETVNGHRRRGWCDANGALVIEAFTINGMAHGVPIAVGNESCGTPGPFFLDAGISSTSHIAHSWGLANAEAKARSPAETANPAAPVEEGSRAIAMPATAEDAAEAGAAHLEPNEKQGNRWPLDPNVVIAAAFKAAGLPAPTDTNRSRGFPRVVPNSIIEAALKAAGLTKR